MEDYSTPTSTSTPTPFPTPPRPRPQPPTPTPTPPPSVTVLSAHWQTLKLSKKKTEKVLVVTYSAPLNPSDAQDLAAYELFSQARKKFTKPDPLTSAAYNASTNTVTLTPKGGKIPAQPLELEIIAGDVLDSLGRPLAGNGTPRGELRGGAAAWGFGGGGRCADGEGPGTTEAPQTAGP